MPAHLPQLAAVTADRNSSTGRDRTKGPCVYVGALTLDVLLGDVRSLKQKRSAVRPLIAEVHRKFPGLAVAETGYLELHRRTEIGVAVVTSTASHAIEVLEACERFVAERPDIELLSARRRLFNDEGE